jgi:alkaline phosphatase
MAMLPRKWEASGKGRKRLAVGFRNGGHGGTSVPITAEGPGALLFTGYMDQTDIFSGPRKSLARIRLFLTRSLRL